MDRHDKQAKIVSRHHSHSLPRESKTGMISRLELQQGTLATHILKSQNRCYQQARIAVRHPTYSLSREPWTSSISRLKLQQVTTVTHHLKSQG